MAHSTVLWWSSLLESTIQRCTQPFHQISNLSIARVYLVDLLVAGVIISSLQLVIVCLAERSILLLLVFEEQ